MADQRGLWREVTFVHDVREGTLNAGVVEAVLSHPVAWFARRVTLDVRPGGRSTRRAVVAQVQAAAAVVGRVAGPHVEALTVPQHALATLATPRAGLVLLPG